MKYLAIAASLLAAVPAQKIWASDPPVRVSLSDDRVAQGDKERVHVKTAKDGYVVVLRMDETGQIRVLYPVDPVDNNSVRGGKEFEVRSRGGREAFTVGMTRGTGLVIAARSDTPFNFSPFMTGDHWNADALAQPVGKDAETTLVGLLDRMKNGHYDYDALPYTVSGAALPTRNYGGRPYYVTGAYDPWVYDYYGAGPYFWPSYGFGATVIVPFGSRGGRRR